MMMRAIDLPTAQAIVRRPDLHSGRKLLAACNVLECLGEWPDVVLAQQLRRQLEAEALRRPMAGVTFGDAMSVVMLFAMLVALFWLAHGLGLPTGGDQLVGGV